MITYEKVLVRAVKARLLQVRRRIRIPNRLPSLGAKWASFGYLSEVHFGPSGWEGSGKLRKRFEEDKFR